MKDLIIILAAVLPALVIVGYIVFRDKNRREPISQVWKGVRYGVGSALLALVVGAPFSVLAEMVPVLDYTETFWGALYGSFFILLYTSFYDEPKISFASKHDLNIT